MGAKADVLADYLSDIRADMESLSVISAARRQKAAERFSQAYGYEVLSAMTTMLGYRSGHDSGEADR